MNFPGFHSGYAVRPIGLADWSERAWLFGRGLAQFAQCVRLVLEGLGEDFAVLGHEDAQFFALLLVQGRHSLLQYVGEHLTDVLQKAVPSLNEQQGEELGIFMAKNREIFAKAFKNQPDALSELGQATAE